MGDSYGGGVRSRCVVVAVVALALAGCSAAPSAQDAAIACGWNETEEDVVSALEADPRQLAEYAARAQVRLQAAQKVARADARFGPLVAALSETAEFADELTTMSRTEIESISNERWDFAKYAQVTARDQCEQLAAVVESQ